MNNQISKHSDKDDVTGYYPYGLPWASMQGQESRLYSGKELERMHALNLYDFHARLYDPQLGRFLSPDPCSTQYEPLSPYLYCAANPILLTDPTGMYFRDESELEVKTISEDVLKNMAFLIFGHAVGIDLNPKMYKHRLGEMQNTLKDIEDAKNDKTHEYILNPYNGSLDYSRTEAFADQNELGHQVIAVYYNGIDDAAHEMKHVGQIARGELIITKGNTSTSNYNAIHEVEAYKAQFGINGVMPYILLNGNDNEQIMNFTIGKFNVYNIYNIEEITPSLIRKLIYPDLGPNG